MKSLLANVLLCRPLRWLGSRVADLILGKPDPHTYTSTTTPEEPCNR